MRITPEQRLAHWLTMVPWWNRINEFGGCHLVVADDNVDDDSIEWCLNQTDTPLTEDERLFLKTLYEEYEEGERHAIAFLALDAVNGGNLRLDQVRGKA